MDKVKQSIKRFIKWVTKLFQKVFKECKDWRTFAILLIVIAVVYSPVWLCYLLYFLFSWKWALAVATTCLAFWAGPFTPFFPLCIAIAVAVKKILSQMIKPF